MPKGHAPCTLGHMRCAIAHLIEGQRLLQVAVDVLAELGNDLRVGV